MTSGTKLNNEMIELLKNTKQVSFVWRQNSGAFRVRGHIYHFGYNGCADVCGMFKGGRLFQFEGKAGNDKLSDEQIENIKQINRDGGLAAEIRNIDELKALLRIEGYIK